MTGFRIGRTLSTGDAVPFQSVRGTAYAPSARNPTARAVNTARSPSHGPGSYTIARVPRAKYVSGDAATAGRNHAGSSAGGTNVSREEEQRERDRVARGDHAVL